MHTLGLKAGQGRVLSLPQTPKRPEASPVHRWRNRPQTMAETKNELSREVVIANELGLHARSAALIAQLAQNAQHGIWLAKGPQRAEATSIMDLIALECPRGTRVVIHIEDPADKEILQQVSTLIENGFGE